ncbi:MAG TPA: C40 family peptidase [Gemmatimonadales bacterium]|jgi:cell wall-associated NlpC family hydrolase|nr:C40 family peptidase [Gemmatimonadales bacterium]
MKRFLLAALGVAAIPGGLGAQGLSLGVSRWLTKPYVVEYRLGLDGYGRGIFRFVVSVEYLNQSGVSKAHWYGGTGDVLIRATPDALPYLVAGGGVGAGRRPSGGDDSPAVGAWGGVGLELVTLGPLGLQAEGLYSWRSRAELSGISLGIRLGARLGKRSSGPPPMPPAVPSAGGQPRAAPDQPVVPRANPADEETIRLAATGAAAGARGLGAGGPAATPAAAEVITTAVAVMGTPYQWGGGDSNGFDCSGLIQYAYAQHGVTIPRRSVEQAQAGSEVGRQLEALQPGDILTFAAAPGGQVAHVGLYLGNGRFIHSATRGVQISILRGGDPTIKWWWERWVGARRVME